MLHCFHLFNYLGIITVSPYQAGTLESINGFPLLIPGWDIWSVPWIQGYLRKTQVSKSFQCFRLLGRSSFMPMGPGTFRQRGGVGEGDWMIKLIFLLWDMILKTTEPGGALVDQSQIYFTLEFRPEMRPAMRCHTVIHPVQLRVQLWISTVEYRL